jgi:hypothetical protein
VATAASQAVEAREQILVDGDRNSLHTLDAT